MREKELRIPRILRQVVHYTNKGKKAISGELSDPRVLLRPAPICNDDQDLADEILNLHESAKCGISQTDDDISVRLIKALRCDDRKQLQEIIR